MFQNPFHGYGSTRRICGFYYPGPGNQRKYLTQLSLAAHCTIIASTSRTTLTQTFINPSEQSLSELRYTFPVYDGVSVVGFTCTVNKDRVIRGVVKEKDEARTNYQEARDRGETAALFESLQQSNDVFTTSVANVPPGAELKVEIVYLGELKHDSEVDGVRFTIPTSIAPRYGDYPGEMLRGRETNVKPKGGMEIVVDAEMPSGCNIKTVQSPSHPISVTLGNTSAGHAAGAEASLQKASATLSLGTAELNKDFVLQVVATGTGDPVAVLEAHPTIPNQRAIMATLVPKFNLPPIRPEIVFVCDRSGSMGTGNRIPNLKSALHIFLKSLPVGVKFNICSFGSAHELLFPEGSKSYDATSLAEAATYVDTFSSNMMGTEMYAPVEAVIRRRYKDMPLQIILLTDGQIWGQERLFTLLGDEVKESGGDIRAFTLGIGNEVSHSLIEGIARAGNGFSQTVTDDEKMNTKVVRMLKASLTPIVKDYTLEVKYGSGQGQGDAANEDDNDDDFEIVEKVMDGLTIDVPETVTDEKPAASTPQKPISLFDTNADPDVDMTDSKDSAARGKYDAVPPVAAPKLLQAPFVIPPLYAFNRTTVYMLLSPETTQQTPTSVVLRGTSSHGPLELEIPVSVIGAKGETIHQLAARSAIRELEDGRGWITHTKDASGTLLKKKYPGRFSDMVEREAVRLGVGFQVACRWCSFVAIEAQDTAKDGGEEPTETASVPVGYSPESRGVSQVDPMAVRRSFAGSALKAAAPRQPQFDLFGSAEPAMVSRSMKRKRTKGLAINPSTSAPAQKLQTQGARPSQQMQRAFGAPFPPPPAAPGGPIQINSFGAAPSGPQKLQTQGAQPSQQMQRAFGAPFPPPPAAPGGPIQINSFGAAPGGPRHAYQGALFQSAPPAPPPMAMRSIQMSSFGAPPQGPAVGGHSGTHSHGHGHAAPQYYSEHESEDEESVGSTDGIGIGNFDGKPFGHEEIVDDAALTTAIRFDLIVKSQSFEGCWAWDEGLFRSLGIDTAKLLHKVRCDMAPQLAVPAEELATAVMMTLLATEMASQKDEWDMLVEKAAEWLRVNPPDGMSSNDYLEAVKQVLADLKKS